MKGLLFGVILAIVPESLLMAAVPLLDADKWQMSEDHQMAYAYQISGDSITLQVELLTHPLIMQSQTAGLVAYFDLTAKKKEKYKVTFPVVHGFAQLLMEGDRPFMNGAPQPPATEDGRAPEPPSPEAFNADNWLLPDSVTPMLTGDSYASLYVDKTEQMIPYDDVFIAYNDGRMFYSCRLPLSRLGDKRSKKGNYNIGIAFKQMTMPKDGDGQSMPSRGGMGGPGGGMGGPGGGMGGPGGGMGGPGGGMGGPGGGMGGPGGRMGRPDGMNGAPNKDKAYKIWIEANLQD